MQSPLKLAEKEVFISAPWGRISALTWGDPSNPPVVLCHGKMDVGSGYRPLVTRLPTCFFYVSVDLPGNGRSDPFPKGGRFIVVDFVPTIERVQAHFKWKTFAYIGHSLGVIIGKYFNFAYPGVLTRIVELDPVPAHHTWEPDGFANWYHIFYGDFYSDAAYLKYNASIDTAPKYSYEKALDMMINYRGLTKEASEHVLDRALSSTGDGLYRFTFDQRLREIPRLPWPVDHLKKLYISTTIPTFAILAQSILDMGAYISVPFIMDESAWPNKNYRFKIVEGGHDVHINNPESIAEDISKFLLEDVKSKL